MAFVLAPLFRELPAPRSAASVARQAHTDDEHEQRERAVDALREIEFDRATGKLSDADYVALKTRYTEEALSAMRAEERQAAPLSDADLEAVIRRQREAQVGSRACPTHGPRPEPDAVYCSDCGRYLLGACNQCGASISAPGARFCDSCGHRLAA
jgi:ParB-like chromosome segregation protein Spo0J